MLSAWIVSGKLMKIRHPRSGERYQLTVDKVEQQTLDSEFIEQIGKGLRNQKNTGIVYPNQYLSVAYHLSPEIALNQFVLESAGQGVIRRVVCLRSRRLV